MDFVNLQMTLLIVTIHLQYLQHTQFLVKLQKMLPKCTSHIRAGQIG